MGGFGHDNRRGAGDAQLGRGPLADRPRTGRRGEGAPDTLPASGTLRPAATMSVALPDPQAASNTVENAAAAAAFAIAGMPCPPRW